MGILSIFRQKITAQFQRWKELGRYSATFTNFGSDLYRSEIVRSCIRPLAEFTSKACARCTDKSVQDLLTYRPNMYMSGKEFLQKVRTLYELHNNVFIYIQRDDRGHACGFYPIPYTGFDALDYAGKLYIRFRFASQEARELVLAWEDLAVLRKDYAGSDISGDDNDAILSTLQLIHTTSEGVANAIKSTANLRGIIKSTKSMLSPEDAKAQRDEFVRSYMTLANEGGIASLDATQEFIPVSMSPVVASHEHLKEFRQDVYRYFGVNDDIIMSNMDAAKIEAFYELRVEPFLVDLSTELTSKVFSDRERSWGHWIVFEANKLQFASLDKKIQMFQTVVQYGGMTINEWRAACNMAPVEGGDEMIRRLDAAPVSDSTVKEDSDE